ncbi:MAG: LysR family transcriptional regulator [Gammaproteobacteria bacterium]
MRITIEGAAALDAIARNGSFALAAKELNKVPSALTYTINKLEELSDITIFDRKGHRAVLTEQGEFLLTECRRLLHTAHDIEHLIALHKTGWEQQITIAYDALIPFKRLLPLIDAFYHECAGVTLKICSEVLSGGWDALIHQSADIAIGVTGDPPIRENLSIKPLGQISFVMVATPNHPLSKKSLLHADVIKNNRIIAVADSSRSLPPRTTGMIEGQEVFTVSTFQEKIEAISHGIGIGYLPKAIAKPLVEKNELVILKVKNPKAMGTVSFAWQDHTVAKAKSWWIEKLSTPEIQLKLLAV